MPQTQAQQAQPSTKIKMTYDEYEKIAQLITQCVKTIEDETGVESVSQAEIVNRLVERLEV